MSKIGAFLVGNLCILLATLFWGVNVAFTKALIPDWMTAYGIVVVRLLGGCLLFWLVSLAVKCEAIAREDWLRIVLGGGVGLFAFMWLFVLSLRYGSAIDISIIMTLPPMFVILIGILFLKVRPSWLEYLGLAISFAGAVIVILGGNAHGSAATDFLLGDILAIASTICYAFYLVILQKPTRKYTPISLLRWVFLFAALPSLVFIPGMENMPIIHSGSPLPWLEIGFILFFPTFIAYFLIQPAIRDIGAELVSLYQYVLPVFATITVVLMGMETLRWSQVAAMGVIVGGMVLTNVGKKKRDKTATAHQ